MATEPRHKPPSDSEVEIWNAIAAFEKILEALPNDRVSLETLADAYEKVGDHTRSKDFILRLATVLIEEADEDAARDLLRKLKQFESKDTEVEAMITRLESLKPEKVMALVMDEDSAATRSSNISEAIAFAWNLLQASKLTQEEYANIVHDLSENSTKNINGTISTLHVLMDRSFPQLSEVLSHVATECTTPLISPTNFELSKAVVSLLPMDFMIKRGAIVFEMMGNDALVAILNPYDAQLRSDIEDLTGKMCHFYLSPPSDFDGAIEKIKSNDAEQEKAKR